MIQCWLLSWVRNLVTLWAFEGLNLEEADLWKDDLPEEPEAPQATHSVEHEEKRIEVARTKKDSKEESSAKSRRFWVKTDTSFDS